MSLRSASSMTKPNVLGIDPSLTSTGVAYRRRDDKIVAYALGHRDLRGMERIAFLRDSVHTYLTRNNPSLVVFEGYALGFRGKSNTIFDIGELGGVLKLLILESGIDILLTPPNSLKLFATGKGNADKDQVMLALRKSLGVQFSTSDQYDATGLLVMGEKYLSLKRKQGNVKLAPHEQKALNGCTLLSAF